MQTNTKINNLKNKINSINGSGVELYVASRVSDTEGIHDFDSEELARKAGILVVFNRCMLAEHRRLGL